MKGVQAPPLRLVQPSRVQSIEEFTQDTGDIDCKFPIQLDAAVIPNFLQFFEHSLSLTYAPADFQKDSFIGREQRTQIDKRILDACQDLEYRLSDESHEEGS